jgi:hypothetical protein
MGPRAGLDILEKDKASLPYRESNFYFSVHGNNNAQFIPHRERSPFPL